MFVDPQQIRALGRQMREQGAEVRAEADALAARGWAVGWTGLAGTAMVGQAVTHAQALRRLADAHDAAACALELHSAAIEAVIGLIAEIERRAHAAIDAARSRIRRFLAGLLDAVDPRDEALAAFSPPPPGSPLWLGVRLPGVSLPGPRG